MPGADRDGLTAGPADRLQAVGGAIVALDSGLGHMSEFLTLSILRVKNSLPLTVSADTTTPRSLSLETRPLISCLRYAPPNRRSGDCKIGVGLDKWGHTRPLYLPTHLVYHLSRR